LYIEVIEYGTYFTLVEFSKYRKAFVIDFKNSFGWTQSAVLFVAYMCSWTDNAV